MKKQRTRVSICCNADDTVQILPNLYQNDRAKLQVQLENISIPHIWYNIAKDTIITFVDSTNTDHTFTVLAGNYDINSFLTNITSVMTALDVGTVYTFSISSNTFTWTITNNNILKNFQITFPTELARRLGSSGTTGPQSTLISQRFSFSPQMLYLYTSLSSIGQGTSYTNLTASESQFFTGGTTVTENTNYIFSLPITSLPGEMENIYLGDVGITFFLLSGNQSIKILISDEFNQILDVSPQKVQLTFVYSVLSSNI